MENITNSARCSASPPFRRKYGDMLSDPSAVLRRKREHADLTSSRENGSFSFSSGRSGASARLLFTRSSKAISWDGSDDNDEMRDKWNAMLLGEKLRKRKG